MFSIDTNLLVYAHNKNSQYHRKAAAFLEEIMNERDEEGNVSVCLTAQVLMEFVNVITRQSLETPLSISEAIQVINDYLETGIKVVTQRETQIRTFLELLRSATTRKKVFDISLAATLKDHYISGLYTANAADFEEFDFLEVVNPLET
ncbi:MAG: PIN domain-containing protein [Candidatus Aminicenantes bacterium]|nr:PIN domain-containing protein [Candidatus Aminicenantes bacterium]NIM83551.1 PIN domain-containing protein [Candidatus Aminicenantes bacterium]NIN22951.1 PIN domain-containing protein [Candidatus Aminicenantes bacterium]NIN46688.1 PIN domain-containing protein [Candidatus Aminicenantes bacterium]NIN89594.1 PIN domain-containing protein [Candidatus Aminicenantes bacterium]